MPRRLALAVIGLALAMTSAACGEAAPSSTLDPSTFAAQVASVDLYVGTPQRVQVGVFSSTSGGGLQLVTFGEIGVRLSPSPDASGSAVETTARYVPAPGTSDAGGTPTLSDPGAARGVFQADDVVFDEPGLWQADVTVELPAGTLALSTEFKVAAEPLYPAPGDRAFATDNLTVDSDAPAQAIDSRSQDGAPIPDPELHATTIAAALHEGKPVLAVFATPVYCVSQFCGPVTDAVQDLAATHPSLASYLHIEIWRNYDRSVINEGAAQWLLRNGDLTEPWLYLIGPDGKVADRWSPLFDVDEVLAELESLQAA